MSKITIIRDVQEKNNFWTFPESASCNGTVVEHLKTGDYSIKGHENQFTIERKFSTGEFAGNITESRFERELDRLDKFEHPYLICEFTWEDMLSFPNNSTIPQKYWANLKVTSNYLIKRFYEIDLNHKTKIILAGEYGYERAKLLFKYYAQKYGV